MPLEIQLDVNVDGNRAWLSKRQEIKYLTTRFDMFVVLQPSYDAGGIRRKKERKQEANPKHDEKRGSKKGSRTRQYGDREGKRVDAVTVVASVSQDGVALN
ncbi:hypothetical protein ALC53_11120 [Atta colombica]|uniref:Uncharacterized protein n=1 Tax=Atta colombica TaxID=520822 RepID=A0A195B2F9_9HYME|nr:hypothetical protein ALC53_11120 [Atta colombica]